jgi:hypothetical protein
MSAVAKQFQIWLELSEEDFLFMCEHLVIVTPECREALEALLALAED